MNKIELRQLTNRVKVDRCVEVVDTLDNVKGDVLVWNYAYDLTDPSQDRAHVFVADVSRNHDGPGKLTHQFEMTADEAERLAAQLMRAACMARMENQINRDELRAGAAVLSDADK